jgi:hypothetical protein
LTCHRANDHTAFDGKIGNLQHFQWARIAQLDRASDYGSEGSRFNSWCVHQLLEGNQSTLEIACSLPATVQTSTRFLPVANTAQCNPSNDGGKMPKNFLRALQTLLVVAEFLDISFGKFPKS